MNQLLKRGFSAYVIIIKNKLAVSAMMLVSGIMMTISAASGRGNDTKTIPVLITAAGVIFSLWSFYRLGYLKANHDRTEDKGDQAVIEKAIALQIIESLAYLLITAAGVYLLLNENVVDFILNLMAGGFTVFNGINGVILLIKRRQQKNYRWIVRLVLTLLELGLGAYFIAATASKSVDLTWLLIMGILTALAGLIEIIAASSKESLKTTVEDGKSVIRTIKTGKSEKSPL